MKKKAFHYPPELLELLIEVIPLLCRSKKGTLGFFTGAGVSDKLLADLSKQVKIDKESINKYEIVRTALTRLNQKGDDTLGERREVLKRVVEFEDFSTCWPNDQLKARGLVAQIQHVVNVKDSFTRMSDERKVERDNSRRKVDARNEKLNKKKREIESLKNELFALFGMKDVRKRGKNLEDVLNKLFLLFNVSVRSDFVVVGSEGEGIVEQVDGAIEIDGELYLVELKWWQKPIGRPEVSEHLVRLFSRAEARAIIISASGYTEPAITTCKEALAQKLIVLCSLEEIVTVLEKQSDLGSFLKKKIQSVIMDKNPFPKIEI